MKVEEDDFRAKASGSNAVNKLADFTTERMREKEKTKRLLIVIVFVLMLFGILIILFAPPEREAMAYVFGAILLVLSLGVIGAQKFVFKFFGITVDTTENKK